MKVRLVPVRLPYKVDFMEKRHRTPDFAHFWEDAAVLIREMDPAEAPVVYRVFDDHPPFAGYRPEDGYCIRSTGDSLWWPLVYRNALMTVSKFEELAASGNTSVLRAFAPSIRAGAEVKSCSFAEFFGRVATRKMLSWLDASLRAAESGAHRTAFIGDVVHVEAGAPLYFATQREKHLQVRAGSSRPDRTDADGNCNTPSVSQTDRRCAARRGLAFGIGELDELMSMPAALDAEEIRVRSRIEAVGPRRRHEQGAPLCARFLAEAMWFMARLEGYDWTLALRKNVPAVADAARPGETYDDLPHRQMLEQLASTTDAILKAEFARDIRAAKDILGRLSLTHLDEEDEDALSKLSALPLTTDRTDSESASAPTRR